MSKHVVFVGIDGAQYSRILSLGDNAITRMYDIPAFTGGVVGTATQQATSSGPGWSTLLTGVWTDQHGITGNSNSPVNASVDTLFERVDAAIADAKIASIVHWGDINLGHFALETGQLSSPSIVDFQAANLSDAQVTAQILDLIANEAPSLTFLQLDDPDHVGHSVGFGSAYDASLLVAAGQVEEILTAVALREAANPGEEWLVIVATDHGRDASGFGHGGQTASERQIFIAANQPIGSDSAAPATSVAATILDFLDISTAGIDGPSLLDATAVDVDAPYLLATLPQDDADSVDAGAAMTFVFNEDVRKGTGSITIHLASDGAVVETIDVNSPQVSIAGGVVTVQPVTPLAQLTGYYVNVDAGAFLDMEDRALTSIFSEDFESLTPSLTSYFTSTEIVDGDPTDWTATPPSGWTHVNNTTTGGVPEFFGWTFHDKNAWIATAADQGRSEFTLGTGVVALVDGDEYYDLGGLASGAVKTVLRTPQIDLADVDAGTLVLSFDSSWRPETPQEVRITVSFDGGAAIEVMRWSSSTSSSNYHAYATNETIAIGLDNPQGAANLTVSFEMVSSGNNWWWAIDNIDVSGVRGGEFGGNAFEGIAGATDFNFTTAADTAGPVATGFSPSDDATMVPLGSDLIVTFDEPIAAGTGAIVIRTAAGALVESIDVTGPGVAISGNTLTIMPGADFVIGEGYYVEIAAGAITDTTQNPVIRTLFSEDFESLAASLQSYSSATEIVDGNLADWTPSAPAGWTQVNTSTPGGVTEFHGWTFHNKASWIATAEDQGRGGFANGSGVVAVADGDEYYDIVGSSNNPALGAGALKAQLITPEIDLTDVKAGTAVLRFDSSWLPESPQEVRITATFDGAPAVEILRWDSVSGSANYKASATNEIVTINLDNPAGAAKVILSFEVVQAGNNWWWAIDDISVTGEDVDTSGNPFAGISGPSAWSFTAIAPTPGNDNLPGTPGDDTIDLQAGDDVYAGGDGNDAITGGAGRDELAGDAGDDRFLIGAGDMVAGEIYDGGSDFDTLEFGSGAFDLTGVSLISIEGIELNGTTLKLASNAQAALVASASGADDRVDMAAALRLDVHSSAGFATVASLFSKGVERVGWSDNSWNGDTVAELNGDGTITVTATDTTNQAWTNRITHFDGAGLLLSETRDMDDGRTTATTFENGVRVRYEIVDHDDNWSFASQTRTYAAGGSVASLTVVQDNGVTISTTYQDGVIARQVTTDVANAFSYQSIDATYDSEGRLATRLQINDNGVTTETTYTAGMLARQATTDTMNAAAYESIETLYDSQGGLLLKTQVNDNGNRIVTGGQADNLIAGGDFNDTLWGGGGADDFVSTGGSDRIRDFDLGEGDRLDLTAFGIDSMASLAANATVTELANATLIDFGGGATLRIDGLTLAQLDDADFVGFGVV